jgi:hypothetical protein
MTQAKQATKKLAYENPKIVTYTSQQLRNIIGPVQACTSPCAVGPTAPFQSPVDQDPPQEFWLPPNTGH